jgi:transcriptional regulator with GAF, ATPase, and Fis domain
MPWDHCDVEFILDDEPCPTCGLKQAPQPSGTLEALRRLLISPDLVHKLRAVVGSAPAAEGPASLPVVEVVTRLLEADLDVAATAKLALDLVAKGCGSEQAFLVLADAEETAFGQDGVSPPAGTSRSVLSEAARLLETVQVADARTDPRFAQQQSVQDLDLRSVICVPILDDKDPPLVGALYLESRAPGAFGARERQLCEHLAALVAAPLRNAMRFAATRQAQLVAERLCAQTGGGPRLVGRSKSWRDLLVLVAKVAPGSHPVLIHGESGSGKELVARELHARSDARAGPFVAENVGALSESLIEAELFGHTKGAFTGASEARPGLFRLADGGTLLLDEIGELSLAAQAKLLRVLQEREVRPVGGQSVVRTTARVVAATHRDLAAEVSAGRFREDLFFRLSVVTVRVPPLRERLADLPLLLEHFLAEAAAELRSPPPQVTPELLERLAGHTWPGNVRELQSYATRLVLTGAEAELNALPQSSEQERGGLRIDLGLQASDEVLELRQARSAFDKAYLRLVLERVGGNVTKAAKLLGMNRSYVSELVKRFDLRRG